MKTTSLVLLISLFKFTLSAPTLVPTTIDDNDTITTTMEVLTSTLKSEPIMDTTSTTTESLSSTTTLMDENLTTTTKSIIDKNLSKKLKLKESLKAKTSKSSYNSLKEQQKIKPKFTTIAPVTELSTSIKTAPTTIKSTTLTSTTITSTTTAAVSTTDAQNGNHVIVLNSNSTDGLIVVDVMDNFGKENSSELNQSEIEIKMDLIDDVAAMTTMTVTDRDEFFTTTITSQVDSVIKNPSAAVATTTSSDDIILINEAATTTVISPHAIKWNEVKHSENSGDIRITFDNIDLPHQNVNVSIENGELIIDSIDISVLNRAEEELRKSSLNMTESASNKSSNSLEILLIEEDGNVRASTTDSSTTIHHLVEHEIKSSNDDIKIKTTDKDSDTIFYISNTEVKLIESIPTSSSSSLNDTRERRKYPAIYEEDVIVDVPSATVTTVIKNRTASPINIQPVQLDKYEEDIVLSPLTSDFDPKDINYIGEAFLDVEESANGGNGMSENHHIIPLTSDVVVQPVELKDMPSVNVPIIGEPPQIELAEMMFADDYDSKQQGNFRMEEFSPFLINNRLVKNELQADEPRSELEMSGGMNGTMGLLANKTHSISVNTVINGTNMTTFSPYSNVTAAIMLETEDIDNADFNDTTTLLVACLATLAPLFLCVIIALIIRYCWRKSQRHNSGNDMTSDKSTDPLAEKNIGGSTDEMKSTESAMTLSRGNGNLQTQSTELLLANANGDVTPNSNNNNGCNHNDTNGSIIKMTMKNNHLIVETEERNDISRDTRETKMHYSPSEKDGVFIVEAARGADQNGSHKPSPLLQKSTDVPLEIPDEIKIDTLQSHFTPSSPEEERKHSKQAEQVEVHTPPAEIKATTMPIENGVSTKTGLSQSDLSLTSSNSSNQNYTYGDRDAYHYEEKGYRGSSPKRIINVHCHDLKPLIENSPPAPIDDNKPIITSAIYKNDDSQEDDSLKSDMQASATNEIITNGVKVHKMNGIIMKNGLDEIISVPDENCNDTITSLKSAVVAAECNGELTMDSLSFLPAPPPDDEQNSNELLSMDSFPPPPPLENDTTVSQS